MEDEYEDLRMDFSFLPGVDLRLWLVLLVSAVAAVGVVVLALTVV